MIVRPLLIAMRILGAAAALELSSEKSREDLPPELKEKNSDLEKKNQAAEAKNDERVSIGGQFRLPNWIESEWGL